MGRLVLEEQKQLPTQQARCLEYPAPSWARIVRVLCNIWECAFQQHLSCGLFKIKCIWLRSCLLLNLSNFCVLQSMELEIWGFRNRLLTKVSEPLGTCRGLCSPCRVWAERGARGPRGAVNRRAGARDWALLTQYCSLFPSESFCLQSGHKKASTELC